MLSKYVSYSIVDLLPEILITIFNYLSPEQVVLIACVNKQFNLYLLESFLWKEKFKKHFFHLYQEMVYDKKIDWMTAFAKTYENEYTIFYAENNTYDILSLNSRKLFSFVKEEDVESVKHLLRVKELDQVDANGVSLLNWAKKTSNQILLDSLFAIVYREYIFNIIKMDYQNRTILHWAILCHQSIDIINFFCQQISIDVVTTSNKTLLMYAAEEGQISTVKFLLACGINIDAQSTAGATALLYAVKNNHQQVVDVLLKHHANVSLALKKSVEYHKPMLAGDTPLHAAIKLGYQDIVVFLLDNGISIHTLGNSNKTLLMYAAEAGQAELVKLLLVRGVNIDAQSTAGATALLYAVKNNHPQVVDVLLKHHANVSLPLRLSVEYHYPLIAGDTSLHAATKLGRPAIVRRLIKNNASIEALNSQHQSPVEVSVKNFKYTNELKLLSYLQNVNRRKDDEYHQYKFLGYEFDFRLFGASSSKEKKEAAQALKSVIIDGENSACLKAHHKALNNGQLNLIRRNL